MVIFTQTVSESINEQVDLFSLFRVFASYCELSPTGQYPCENRLMDQPKNSFDGFVGANSFARSMSYVRMNSHLQKRHNPLK